MQEKIDKEQGGLARDKERIERWKQALEDIRGAEMGAGGEGSGVLGRGAWYALVVHVFWRS